MADPVSIGKAVWQLGALALAGFGGRTAASVSIEKLIRRIKATGSAGAPSGVMIGGGIGGGGPAAPPSDADYRRYGIEPPFYPPVPYEKPKEPARPRKPMTSPEGRGVLREAGRVGFWGVGVAAVNEVLGIPSATVAKAERAAEDAQREADRLADELRRRDRELKQENRVRQAMEREAREQSAVDRKAEKLLSAGRAAAAREKRVKAAQKAAEKQVREQIKAGAERVAGEIEVYEPLPPPTAQGISLAIPPWARSALVLGTIADRLRGKETPTGSASRFVDPLTQEQFDSGFALEGLTGVEPRSIASTEAAALSTETEVCSCRPRKSKRRRGKRGTKRICYDRKVNP